MIINLVILFITIYNSIKSFLVWRKVKGTGRLTLFLAFVYITGLRLLITWNDLYPSHRIVYSSSAAGLGNAILFAASLTILDHEVNQALHTKNRWQFWKWLQVWKR